MPPRWPRHLAVLLALAAVAAAFLLPRDLILGAPGSDVVATFAGWRAFAAQTLWSGHLPLWNPYGCAGEPFLGGFQSALLYPPNLVFLILPLAPALNLSILLHLEIVGWGMGRWALRRGLHPGAAVLCAVAIVASGPVFPQVFAGHLSNLCALAWGPWILSDLELGARGGGLRAWLRAAAGICLQVLAGHPQYVLFIAVAAGLQAVWAAALDPDIDLRPLGGLILAYCFGAVLAGAQLFPGFAAAGETVRQGGLNSDLAGVFSFPPENVITLLAPDFFGRGYPGESYWGRWQSWEMCLFAGTVAVILAAVAGCDPDRRRSARFDLGLAALLLVFAFGANSPLFTVLRNLPGLDQSRGFSKFTFPAMMFFVLAVGGGTDAVIRRRDAGRLIPGLALIVSMGILAAGAWLRMHPGAFHVVLAAVKRSGETYAPAPLFENPPFCLAAGRRAGMALVQAGIAGAACAAALLGQRRWPRLRWVPIFLFPTQVAVFAVSWTAVVPLSSALPAAADLPGFVRAHPGDYRIRFLSPTQVNAGFLIGAPDIWGDDPAVLRRYGEFMAYTQGKDLARAGQAEAMARPWDPLYALLRCHYVMVADRAGATRILETPDALPHALLVSRYEVVRERGGIFSALRGEAFDPRGVVLLEREPKPRPTPSDHPGSARVVAETPDSLTIEADAAVPAVLLITDLYSGGWRAEPLAGSAQDRYEIQPADYILRAIPLAAGHHRLRLVYDPVSFRIGLVVSLAAWVGWLALWRRRHSAAPRTAGPGLA